MTTMQQKNATSDGSVYFEPVVLKVAGYSQYRPDSDVRFEDVPDFWQLPEKYQGEHKPPVGTIARFSLKTKPKSGPNAKPGSMYRDIVKIEKADPSEYTGAPQAPQAHANGAGEGDTADYAEKRAAGPQNTLALPPIEQRILLGMAFNNLTTMLAGANFINIANVDEIEEATMLDQWLKWYGEASQGRPLSPVAVPCACDCGCPNNSGQGEFDGKICRPCAGGSHQPQEEAAPQTVAERAGAALAEAKADAEDRQELPW